MKRYKVIVTGKAKAEIREIKNYIAKTLHEPRTADRILVKLLREVDSLETMPERYPLVRDDILSERGYRMAGVGNYLLFYTVDQTEKTVNIVRVLHGSRNWMELLK